MGPFVEPFASLSTLSVQSTKVCGDKGFVPFNRDISYLISTPVKDEENG
jgi:hypothetical protein